MAVARKKRTKAEPHEPNHAIRVLVEAHNDLRAKCASGLGGVGACFDSDLEHDKIALRAKRAYNDSNAFVWIVAPHATHMMRIGTDSDALANVSKRSIEATTFRTFIDGVLSCYDQTYIDAGYVRAYVYQPGNFEGVLASANRSKDGPIDRAKLYQLIADQVRSAAIDALAPKLKDVREDLANAKHDDRTEAIEHYTQEEAKIEREIERIREWGARDDER